METVTERLYALFRKYPGLADGEHDKELIAKYLELHHNFTIPLEVLREIPSFETIRRTRQYYSAEMEAAAGVDVDRESRVQVDVGVRFLKELIEARGYVIEAVPPMISRLGGLEPTLYGVKEDVALVGLVWPISDMVAHRPHLVKVLDFLGWVQSYPRLDRIPILVLLGDLTPEGNAVIEELKVYGWEVRFA